MHYNLFRNGHSTKEVYEALTGHQKRDFRLVWLYDIAALLGLIAAVTDYRGLRLLGVIVAFYAITFAFRLYLDIAGRNFFLHRLDWDRAVEWEKANP